MNQIVFSDVSFSYQSNIIFEKFNLAIPLNQFSAVLGASGIGKTTLLRLLANLEKANSGTIVPNLSGKIAWMGQRDLLLPWSSVFENIILGKKLRRETINQNDLKEQVELLLKKVGLKNCLEKKPHELSIGMRQRVALARTLFEDKQIILMDEPFASVDVVIKSELQQLIAELLRNKTVVMVTHDPQDALCLADFIYVLSQQPIHVIEVIEPKGMTPRKMDQNDIWQLHQFLFEKIQRVKSNSI